MSNVLPPDMQDLLDQLDASDGDVDELVRGLSEPTATRRPPDGGWCVTECLDHLAVANEVYIAAMREPAAAALARGRARRGPARPGLIGSTFVRMIEPPPRRWARMPMPRKIAPRETPSLASALTRFRESQQGIRSFIHTYAGVDLNRVTFPNPFVPGIRFSLATGLHVLAAHERRHLLQARRARRAVEVELRT